jgi:serine/threonine protein kinase
MDNRLNKRFKMDLDQWKTVKTIGRGLFGKVRLVKNKEEGKYRAMKIMQKSQIVSQQQMDHIYSEFTILKEIEHPFIVSNLNNI